MLGPHINVRQLVPRARVLAHHSPAYELELATPDGEVVLIVSNEGRGGCNNYSNPQVARVLEQQARHDFPTIEPLDTLCAALADGAESYTEAVVFHTRYLEIDAAFHPEDRAPVETPPADPHVERQLLALGLDAFGLPFEVDDRGRCVLVLPGGGEIVAWSTTETCEVTASWPGGDVQGSLDVVAARIHDLIGGGS